MDWPTAATAIAAAVVSGGVWATVAVWAVRSQAATSREEREHSRLLAQEAGQQERRGDAYVEILAVLQRFLTGVDRTEPIMTSGEPTKPPPPLKDEDLWRLNAMTAAMASKNLQDMVRE
jgi:hypothetical protein